MRATRALAALLTTALLVGFQARAVAQFDSPFGSSGKGRIRGIDVTLRPDVVFVLDVSGSTEQPA